MCDLMSPCKETYLNYSVIETKAMPPPLGSRGVGFFMFRQASPRPGCCVLCVGDQQQKMK